MVEYNQRFFQKRAMAEAIALGSARTALRSGLFRQLLDQDLVTCRNLAREPSICGACRLKLQCDQINTPTGLLAA